MNKDSATNIWGIDVSHHNGDIDWEQVRQSGCRFAFIKATEGATFRDKLFETNRKGARAAGILTGAYHFVRTTSTIEAQLENFKKTPGVFDEYDLAPALDVELTNQWQHLPPLERVDFLLAWLTGVSEMMPTGIVPLIYLSPNFADETLQNDPRLGAYPLWIAHYTNAPQPRLPAPWTRWQFWQYTNKGRVAGISGDVDINRFSGQMHELDHLRIGTHTV